MRSGAAGRILSASKTTESFLTIRNCRSSFTAARSASRTTLIQRRYLKSCLRATAGAIPGATAFTIMCTITRALTKCSGSRAAMPGFASAANAEKRFTSRPAMWWSCRPEPATSDWPPAKTCWWSAHTRPSAVTTNAAPARPTTIAPSRGSPRSRLHARTRCTDVMVRSRVFGAGPSSSGASAVWSLLKDTAANWSKHKAARLGAALAYYSIFSLGPLLVIAVAVAGLTFREEAVRGEVGAQLRALLGDAGAQAVNAMLLGASKPREGTLATVLGVGALMFAAVGVVVQLKDALNTVWEVEPPKASGIWDFVRTYMVSLAAVLSLGFLLLVSLLLTSALAAGGKYIAPYVPELAMHALGSLVSFGMITLVFAMMFKWLPDTYVAWRDVWLGAAVTAALFEIGKLLIGLYIGKQALESTFGAAASLVVLLIWVYYSSQLVLMGAEFTRAHARRRGHVPVNAQVRTVGQR